MDILDRAGGHPEPNLNGVNFDCQECRRRVTKAFYDRRGNTIKYWCDDGHESILEEVGLDI